MDEPLTPSPDRATLEDAIAEMRQVKAEVKDLKETMPRRIGFGIVLGAFYLGIIALVLTLLAAIGTFD